MWYKFGYGLFNLSLIKQIIFCSEKKIDECKRYYLIGYDVTDRKNYLDSFDTLEEAEAAFEKVSAFLTGGNVVQVERKAIE